MVLTLLSLIVGYLTISMSTALLYAAWLSGAGNAITPQFLAFASICGLGFAALGGWLAALVAQRAPITHAIALSLMLSIISSIYLFTHKTSEPLTLSLLNLAIQISGVLTGGWLRLRQMKAQDQMTG